MLERMWKLLRQQIAHVTDLLRWRLLVFTGNAWRIRILRKRGVRIGENCLVFTIHFSSEPYLIEIGNHVAISAGTTFVTHDASGWVFSETHPDLDLFGPIKVGDNTYFGTDCTILPNTQIGSNCVIGSGSVVRGTIPDNSVVMGNPARVVMKTSLLKQVLVHHKNRLDTRQLPPAEKERVLRRHFGIA
jgi:acetyltransferase-like isoleucine patch superfamily enzyme